MFHPQTGEVRSDDTDGIACWFVDTDYNGESFFVRRAVVGIPREVASPPRAHFASRKGLWVIDQRVDVEYHSVKFG